MLVVEVVPTVPEHGSVRIVDPVLWGCQMELRAVVVDEHPTSLVLDGLAPLPETVSWIGPGNHAISRCLPKTYYVACARAAGERRAPRGSAILGLGQTVVVR